MDTPEGGISVSGENGDALDLTSLRLFVADRIAPFFRRVLEARGGHVVALHVIGSAVTDDFDPERSDINSLIVLDEMDLEFLDVLGSLCRQFRDERVGPPTLMTPQAIQRCLDASPVELLDIRLVNTLVYGTDLLAGLHIPRSAVRLQCERELRHRLLLLTWGYVGAADRKRRLTELLHQSVFGLAPLVRGVLYARGEEPPTTVGPLFDALASLVGGAALSFKEVYWMKLHETKMPVARVRAILKDYYHALEILIDVADRIDAPDA